MKKILLQANYIALLLLASCREKGAIIATSGAKPADTSYMAAIEKPQKKVVLLEEFTGVSCAPCVKGHAIIYGPNGIEQQHPEQVAVIACHVTNHPLADPVKGHSRTDFRTEDATNVGTSIFGGLPGLPTGGIDRTQYKGGYLYDRDDWSLAVNNAVTETPVVNVYVTSQYNEANRSATVTLKTAFTQQTKDKLHLTLAVIENNIIDAQKNGITNTTDENYTHMAVLRDIVTEFYGDALLDNTEVKEAGLVYERTFRFNLKPEWNAANCELVAFVHNFEGDKKNVLQAAKAPLK